MSSLSSLSSLFSCSSGVSGSSVSFETAPPSVTATSVRLAQSGRSVAVHDMGMRDMQKRAYDKRNEQYLLIKSPPASGKSRALMFLALDKLHHQGVKKALIAVPEKSIGASFHDEPLSQFGFFADWKVTPQWNLCDAPGGDENDEEIDDEIYSPQNRLNNKHNSKLDSTKNKVAAVEAFLNSEERVLICTHATFRFAVDALGVAAFDDCLIAIDEFHHVSANPDNRLGSQLKAFIDRDKVHIIAMTGSYFRGDAEPVLLPEDESKFTPVVYTYYEQLNGYQHLKQLDIGYFFYDGIYLDDMEKVLNPNLKTIVHIPHVNSRESTHGGKKEEVNAIIGLLGTWKGIDEQTGFHCVQTPDGRVLKVADLVDDSPVRYSKVLVALKDPTQKNNRDHVDIIIALGMAKEGFDWIWCEHALTVGYRASLTEVIQIIGRTTRDAPGKTHAAFTNLIAKPDAEQDAVTNAVNDTLKAIAASLLMEQVLAPKMTFTAKNAESKPIEGFDYGPNGYNPNATNVGFCEERGEMHIEIKKLTDPLTDEARRVCQEDMHEVLAKCLQDPVMLRKGLFEQNLMPAEITIDRAGKIVKEAYPHLGEQDRNAITDRAIAAMVCMRKGKEELKKREAEKDSEKEGDLLGNTAMVDGVRRYALNVRELDVDLIHQVNPFGGAYAILAKSVDGDFLKQMQEVIAKQKNPVDFSPEEAKKWAEVAKQFKEKHGRFPESTAQDFHEKYAALGAKAFLEYHKEGCYTQNDKNETT